MSKIKLVLKSSEVADNFANINIVVNGNIVDQARQLSATSETVIIDANLADKNTLYFDILNSQAIDTNGDGQFDSVNDQTMYVTLSEMQVSEDDVNFTQLIPQAAQTTTLKGLTPPHVDRRFVLIPSIVQEKFWGMNESMGFTKDRIIEINGDPIPTNTVQGNQIFVNGVFDQELTDSYYWG
jgi:hypothetical protein